jgi:hypothetical protein
MSDYGKLWQQVADLRLELKRWVPGSTMNTLKIAREERNDLVRRIDQALASWAALERRMVDAPD